MQPNSGRILVFSVSSPSSAEATQKLDLISEKAVKGAVFSLSPFSGGKLLSSINSKIQLFNWANQDASSGTKYAKILTKHCSHHGHVLALFAVAHGDYIIVGNRVHSFSPV